MRFAVIKHRESRRKNPKTPDRIGFQIDCNGTHKSHFVSVSNNITTRETIARFCNKMQKKNKKMYTGNRYTVVITDRRRITIARDVIWIRNGNCQELLPDKTNDYGVHVVYVNISRLSS